MNIGLLKSILENMPDDMDEKFASVIAYLIVKDRIEECKFIINFFELNKLKEAIIKLAASILADE